MSSMYVIRPAVAQDLPFIMNSWLKRYRDACHPRLVTDAVYYAAQQAVIHKILSVPDSIVLIACDPDDANHIYGYCVGERLTPDWAMLHWVYIKGAFRKFGLAKHLVNEVIGSASKIQHTHRTKLTEYLNKEGKSVFVPQYVWAIL